MDPRIQLLHEDPHEAITQKWARDPKVFDLFIADTLSIVDSNPRNGKGSAKTILVHAPTACQRVQGYGLWAQIHRAIGKLAVADTAIADGFFLGEGCLACRADLHRRRADLRRNRRDWPAALKDANEAIQRYVELGHPGHDIDKNGLASSYNVRAGVHLYAGDYAKAIRDEQQALAVLDPRVSPVLYRFAIFNLAYSLQSTDERSDLLESEKYLTKAQQLFSGVQENSQERSKLNWVTSQVRYQLEKGQPYTLRKPMVRAMNFFLAEGMDLEAVAIAADLMKMKLARRRWGYEAPREMIRKILATLHKGLPRLSPKQQAEPQNQQLRDALHEVRRAVDTNEFNGRTRLKSAIDALRAACGPDQIACLLTWPP